MDKKLVTVQQTPDREKKIVEIREALEKATPGTWKWIDPGGHERKKLVGEYEIMNFGASMPYSEVAGQEPDDADAHLIANAPEWLRFLLDELERKDEVIEEQKRELFYKSKEITELREKSWQDQQWFKQASANITEMQKELERIEREYAEERAAHNAHVTELCELEQERNMYKASSEVFYERLKKADEERNRLFERLKDITSTLGGVTFTDGRQWGVYNALCDIVKDIEKELSK